MKVNWRLPNNTLNLDHRKKSIEKKKLEYFNARTLEFKFNYQTIGVEGVDKERFYRLWEEFDSFISTFCTSKARMPKGMINSLENITNSILPIMKAIQDKEAEEGLSEILSTTEELKSDTSTGSQTITEKKVKQGIETHEATINSQCKKRENTRRAEEPQNYPEVTVAKRVAAIEAITNQTRYSIV